jgi:hypothetical protein
MALQQSPQRRPDDRFIFDDQNLRHAVLPLCSRDTT